MNLKDKKILFFAPDFFGYDLDIKKELENRGAIVHLYNERPSTNFLIKSIIRLKPNILSRYSCNYYKKIIDRNAGINYDYIFILKGEVITRNIVSELKDKFPNAKFILYLWDSLKNYESTYSTLDLFDKVSTFDKDDAEQNKNLHFRPLFYTDAPDPNKIAGIKYDILFIGTLHSDRWLFLNKIKKDAQSKNLRVFYYLYFYNPLLFFIRKIIDKKMRTIRMKDVSFSSLSKTQINQLMDSSAAIIDIQHPKQTGLTMRTIEVLGARKKLITTNESIVAYDFYNPANIYIVDRTRPAIPTEFLTIPYCELSPSIYYKYSIAGWVDDVL